LYICVKYPEVLCVDAIISPQLETDLLNNEKEREREERKKG